VFVDLDADDDGQSALGGDAADVALGGDVNARIDYAVGGFRLGIDLAQASLMMDASGTAYFSGSVPARLFMGTSLSSFEPATDLAVRGVYHSATDYALLVRGDGRLLGLPFSQAQVELGSAGVKLGGRLEVPGIGPVDVAGAVGTDGSWAMAGRARDLTFAGLPLTGVEVALSPRGTTISAGTSFAGRPFRLTGTVTPGGVVSLTGTIALTSSSRVQLTLDGRGARAAFLGRVCAGAVCLDVPVTEIDTQGNVCPNFPLVGRQCVRVL
jgi:hypothetical protein